MWFVVGARHGDSYPVGESLSVRFSIAVLTFESEERSLVFHPV